MTSHDPLDGPPDPPVFARDELLARLGGDDSVLAPVLEVFVADLPDQQEELFRAMAASDAAAVQRRAHAIKGAAANVGALALRAAALALEEAARAGDIARIPELAARVEQEIQRFASLVKV